MTMLYLDEDEYYPLFTQVKEGAHIVAVDVPDDFIFRFQLLHKQFFEAQFYIRALRDGEVLSAPTNKLDDNARLTKEP